MRTSAHDASPTAVASVRNAPRSVFSSERNRFGAASRQADASSYERSATDSMSVTSRASSPMVMFVSSPGLALKYTVVSEIDFQWPL